LAGAVLVLVFTGSSTLERRQIQRLRQRGSRSTAEVLRTWQKWVKNGNVCHVEYRFEIEGQTFVRQAEMHPGFYCPGLPIGNRIPVLYMPENPRLNRLQDEAVPVDTSGFLALMLAGLAFAVIMPLLYGRKGTWLDSERWK
jgi:Protein of unknown function (DUF3592)